MTRWFDRICLNWLSRRGYYCLRPEIPYLIMTHASGTFKNDAHGTTYHIHMPRDHKLWVLFNTILVPEEE